MTDVEERLAELLEEAMALPPKERQEFVDELKRLMERELERPPE